MKKQAFLRGLLGFPMGIALGYMITIFISIALGQGQYIPCVPELVDTMGSELNAIIFQTVLSGLLGSSFSASSVIWEIDSWSIAKQTGIHFLITAFVMMPIAYFTNWMEHTLIGFLSYFVIFVVIFVAVWFFQYFGWRNKIKKMNAKVKEKREN